MNINVHIERLVLHDFGIRPHQKSELKAAVESELRQQLANQGIGSMMQLNYNRQSVRGDSISFENIRNSGTLGGQIGSAVYGGISK